MALERSALVEFFVSLGVASDLLDSGCRIFTDGLLDSFSMVDLISFVEKETGQAMPPSEVRLENLDTIDGILRYAGSLEP